MPGLTDIQALHDDVLGRIAAAPDAQALETVRIEWLGRKAGRITTLLKSIPTVPPADRAAFGQAVNALKAAVTDRLAARKAELEGSGPRGATVDVTMPGRPLRLGRLHPITRATREMVEIFGRLGFACVEGPEVEDEWHNFVGLNIPPAHPARDPLDNYYLNDNLLLRTQTSTVQIRIMENQPPPIRAVAPGRVYRPDTVDAGHSNMFHQLEGLWVDEGVTFADLKSVLTTFARAFIGPHARTRFLPSYFPFTEPSAEFYFSCLLCGGSGCPACKRTGWMEVGGCGMVDPNVFEAVGYDPEKVTGLAFGFGIDRSAMLKYGIRDIRLLFENDVRFLRQF
ncbi:MAG TPA: phenylalanine--tRNA ligase subunit alpha [Phycisphaerae bacterium]|nr:phenylalanine--tRNA ligase subunit alpha [Phycisphaerae bacterium]